MSYTKKDWNDLFEGYKPREEVYFKNNCKTKETLIVEHFMEHGDVFLCASQLKVKKEKVILILTESGLM